MKQAIIYLSVPIGYFALTYFFYDWLAAHQVWLLMFIICYLNTTQVELLPVFALARNARKISAAIGGDFNQLIGQLNDVKQQLQDVQYELEKMQHTLEEVSTNTAPPHYDQPEY